MQVTSYFSDVVAKNEESISDCLEEDVGAIQEICFFLKTFCSEIELHTQILKSKTEDEVVDPDIIENGQLIDSSIEMEYQQPENPNELYPYEVYADIFTFLTVDITECKEEFISAVLYSNMKFYSYSPTGRYVLYQLHQRCLQFSVLYDERFVSFGSEDRF